MKIGELSLRCEVSVRMLRYYEAQGLLKPRRTASGYRDFSDVDVQTVERIKLLGSGGMTLAMIRQFAPCVRGDDPIFEPCDELRAALHDYLRLIDHKAEELRRTRNILEKFMRAVEL
ncbi:MerR family transcriptional regulator [Duganella sp. BJB488]|uniref:MerR family transcriptional regulator n=2 Tax=Duganella TaxID=75654 RepID=UPI000E349D93|nr:MerR family transcriptional regulator [Duganella sp. BJB489]RFP26610.1 MerR family transcriptional regulator [Duganella sp. BJB488]RFP34657.1 MerR family transcriptional regulator [Duganella sp. BJB480]